MQVHKYLSIPVRVLVFYSLSVVLLFLLPFLLRGVNENQLISKIISQGGHYTQMEGKYHSVESISRFTFMASIIQAALLLPLILINLFNWKDDIKATVYSGALFFSLGFANISVAALYSAMLLFSIIPITALYYITIAIVFISALLMFLMQKADKEEIEKPLFYKAIIAGLEKFGFPHHRLIYFICLALFMLCLITGAVLNGPHLKTVHPINYFGAFFAVFGVVYLMAGRHFKLKKLDELQRLIHLEASFNATTWLIGFILSALFISMALNIDIKIQYLALPLAIIATTAVAVAEKKYN